MKYVIGIDEVGRGPLAGPVVVCAAMMPKAVGGRKYRVEGITVRDSKKLTENQREICFAHFLNNPEIKFAVAKVSPKVIDRINISRATNQAALRAFRSLAITYDLQPIAYSVFLDGGLYLGNKKNERGEKGISEVKSKTVIKGDDKILAVSIASIIAKVMRDRLMARLAKKYPNYGFEVHKGYGTLRHRKAIKRHGPSKVHRLTFLRSVT